MTAHHCPACQVVAELEEHRDQVGGGWSIKRGTLNFAIIVARQACPAYEATAAVADESTPAPVIVHVSETYTPGYVAEGRPWAGGPV